MREIAGGFIGFVIGFWSFCFISTGVKIDIGPQNPPSIWAAMVLIGLSVFFVAISASLISDDYQRETKPTKPDAEDDDEDDDELWDD